MTLPKAVYGVFAYSQTSNSLRTSLLCCFMTSKNAFSSNFSPVVSSMNFMTSFICARAYLSVDSSSQRMGMPATVVGIFILRSISWLFIVEESQGMLFVTRHAPTSG